MLLKASLDHPLVKSCLIHVNIKALKKTLTIIKLTKIKPSLHYLQCCFKTETSLFSNFGVFSTNLKDAGTAEPLSLNIILLLKNHDKVTLSSQTTKHDTLEEISVWTSDLVNLMVHWLQSIIDPLHFHSLYEAHLSNDWVSSITSSSSSKPNQKLIRGLQDCGSEQGWNRQKSCLAHKVSSTFTDKLQVLCSRGTFSLLENSRSSGGVPGCLFRYSWSNCVAVGGSFIFFIIILTLWVKCYRARDGGRLTVILDLILLAPPHQAGLVHSIWSLTFTDGSLVWPMMEENDCVL